jgi:oxygen-independent coproporphyrinogen-3 oxidase
MIDPKLIKKYNRPVPRYTSYPTVPYWEGQIDRVQWQKVFAEQFAIHNGENGISIYIHLPFCESLCTYCGCNKKITTNHSVEESYLEAIATEWSLYRALMNEVPVIREIHLGGGTPTFFSPLNLLRLINVLLTDSIIHPTHEFSIEGHPNNTTMAHLEALHSLGFRRISYGVQDLDPEVQKIINRIQPLENVQRATDDARAAGFTSVNFDLIYGLPLQTAESLERTISQVIGLRPDRIAFYSYAHVPWTSRGQRLFDESQLPSPEEKLRLYTGGQQQLLNSGYLDIGMDHFALPHDSLYAAREEGTLHRNFMGYTTNNTQVLVGLGVSAISDVGNAFAQNEKSLHDYYAAIDKKIIPVKKGYFLSDEDIAFRQYIKDITCKGFTVFEPDHLFLLETYCFPELEQIIADGLAEYNSGKSQLSLTPTGHYFMRNVCSTLDLYLQRNVSAQTQALFSKAI